MAWTRIDDGFRTNIKVRKAGPDGVLLYLYGLLHCNTNLTDGYIDDVFLPQIYADAFCRTPKVTVKKLVECGLWIRMEGGYQVNDYLEYNFTKEEIEKRRQAKVEAGRKGGRTSTGSKPEADDETKDEADAQASAQAKSNPIPIAHNPLPIPQNPNKAAAAFNGGNEGFYSQLESLFEVTPNVKKAVDQAVETYGFEWVKDVIAEGVVHNAKTFAYMTKILATWKENGKPNNGSKKSKDTRGSYEYFKGLRKGAA